MIDHDENGRRRKRNNYTKDVGFLRVGDDFHWIFTGRAYKCIDAVLLSFYSQTCWCMGPEVFVAKHWTIGQPSQGMRTPHCPKGNKCPEFQMELWKGEPQDGVMVWLEQEVWTFRDVEFLNSIHADDSICSSYFSMIAASGDVMEGSRKMITDINEKGWLVPDHFDRAALEGIGPNGLRDEHQFQDLRSPI